MNSTPDEGIYELAPAESPKPRPRTPPQAGNPIPCPSCGYDLRGNAFGRCPECGKVITLSALRHAKAKRKQTWRDSPAIVAALCVTIGTGVALLTQGVSAAITGDSPLEMMVFMGIFLAVSLVVACVVYFLCAAMWIGWSQNVGTTMLQVCAAYGLSFGAGALLGQIPFPFLPWFASVVILIGLLIKFLEIDIRDAAIVAVLVWVARSGIGLIVAILMWG